MRARRVEIQVDETITSIGGHDSVGVITGNNIAMPVETICTMAAIVCLISIWSSGIYA